MPDAVETMDGWPPGWGPKRRRAWEARGLDVEQARWFTDSGWTPAAALDGVSELGDDEVDILRSGPPPTIRPGSAVGDVLRLHRAGVVSATNGWDAAAVTVLEGLGWADEVAARLRPGDDPRLTVLAVLHEVDADLPAGVGLTRHRGAGCYCDGARFTTYLGMGRLQAAEKSHTVVMTTDVGTTLRIRTGRYLAARVGSRRWVPLPDLASACWYLHQMVPEEEEVVVEVDDTTTGLSCVMALARLRPVDGDLEIEVACTTLIWNGFALLPRYDVPDWMVVASSSWDGDSGTPLNSGGTTYLIESDGDHYFGGDEMGWSEVGPFDSDREATAWFYAEIGETG
jgi:hypothetical protein